LPRLLGGIPLDEIGATGFGVAQAAEVAAESIRLDLKGATVAIEGFGNVGRHAARFLAEKGAVLVAASDSRGAVYRPGGIDLAELMTVKQKTGTVTEYGQGAVLPPAELFALPCDILVPAARPDSIHHRNAAAVRAKLVVPGANIAVTAEAEQVLHQRGILVLPDFIANAGGVICAAIEYRGGAEADAFEQIAQRIRRNTAEVLGRSRDAGIEPRKAAVNLARERVRAAMKLRRSYC
jgi:glutamate dehydrogenase/leucine dehydrogenase